MRISETVWESYKDILEELINFNVNWDKRRNIKKIPLINIFNYLKKQDKVSRTIHWL